MFLPVKVQRIFFFFFSFGSINRSAVARHPGSYPPSQKFQSNMMKFFPRYSLASYNTSYNTEHRHKFRILFFFHSHNFRSRASIPTEEHHRNFPTLLNNQLLISFPSSLEEFLKVRPAIIMWTDIQFYFFFPFL